MSLMTYAFSRGSNTTTNPSSERRNSIGGTAPQGSAYIQHLCPQKPGLPQELASVMMNLERGEEGFVVGDIFLPSEQQQPLGRIAEENRGPVQCRAFDPCPLAAGDGRFFCKRSKRGRDLWSPRRVRRSSIQWQSRLVS